MDLKKYLSRRNIIIAAIAAAAAAGVIAAVIVFCSGKTNAAPAAPVPESAVPESTAEKGPAVEKTAAVPELPLLPGAAEDKYKATYDRLEAAAEKGSADAWFSLGKLYYAGIGCSQPPYRWALRCFRKAASLSPSAAAERYIASCNRKISAERAADLRRETTPVAVMEQQSLPMAKMLQSEGVDQAGEILRDLFRSGDGEFYLEKAIPVKRYMITGWNFDARRCYALLREKMTLDREGSTLLMSEEFEKEPLSKNLLNVNPTIRYMNAAVQRELEEKSLRSFPRAGKADTDAMVSVLAGDIEDMKQYLELSAWHISGGLYFGISVDNSGAWRLRRYVFFLKDGKTFYLLSRSHDPVSRDDTVMPAGLLVGEAAALNNAAVSLNNNDARAAALVEKLLLRSSRAGCITADRNLLAFYLYHKRKEKAGVYLDKLRKTELLNKQM